MAATVKAPDCSCDNSGTQACDVCAGGDVSWMAHSQEAGALCTFSEDTGCCTVCGVGNDECPMCSGVGYHKGECAMIEEVV